jgi:hypothetical protein
LGVDIAQRGGVSAFFLSFPRKRESIRASVAYDSWPKIFPVRVLHLDQLDLPATIPLLQLLLSHDRGLQVAMQLERNEPVDRIALREAVDYMTPVLPSPTDKVASDTDVQCFRAPIRKHIGRGLSFQTSLLLWWIPAFAGMTSKKSFSYSMFG